MLLKLYDARAILVVKAAAARGRIDLARNGMVVESVPVSPTLDRHDRKPARRK